MKIKLAQSLGKILAYSVIVLAVLLSVLITVVVILAIVSSLQYLSSTCNFHTCA
jgi:hypothetical protein